MKCSFCSSKKVKDDQMPFCDNCWNALEKSEVPPIEFKEFFLEGLEGKLKDVDSFLFNLPDNFFLWYMKGHLEHELGSTKKALNSIKTSISYKEDYGDSWIRLGLIYSDMHKENDAIENFKKGLRFTLRDPSNLVDAGISLQASDHSKLASMILQRALDLVPDDDRAIVGLGKVYSQIGQLDDAKNILERGLELYPHNEEVLRAMAQIILRMEDMDSAMEIYSRILDQHPRDFEALLAKAEIHLRKRELNSSIKTYQAVRDLDIHISWSGIMKFLISSIRSIFEDNQNSLSYRDDLKKEFENILLYLKDLDQRSSSSTGSEIMDNIEKLVKIVESLKLSLKDQLEQFEELLDKYKVENSFHHHLEGKVKNLKDFISDGRYFDAKQITLELSPFLMDLRKMNTRDEAKVKKNLRSKLRELKEFGMENKDLSIRLDEIEKLEEEGNSEGATFMLKEIELSLEEYYIECSTDLHEIKIKEMETLLKEAKNRFDTSGLKEKLEKFGNFQGWGPKEIGQKYMDFIKQYEKGSSTYYLDETRKMLKEIDYKLVILEKDEMKVKGPRERHRDLQSEAEDRSAPGVVFQKVTNFMKEIQEIEENHKVSAIRERLRELDTLLGEVDLLGMDNALAKNVEPVRGVIERSLKQNNFRLSEILTNEVYENVEKLLREKYLKKIKEILTEMEGEIFRFKGLGIHRKDWSISIERSNSIILKKAQGEITEVISHMARVQSEVQKFYIDELPDEIDRKISDSEQLLEEGEGLGLKLDDLKNKITRMASSAEDISTLDLLEDTYKLETDLEKEIRGQLSENVRTFANEIRKKAERIDGLSLTKRDVLKLISSSNRAEVILENGQERDAYRMIIDTMEQMDRIWEEVLNELKERRLAEIDELMNISNKLNIGISDFEEDRSVLVMEKEPDPYSNLELAEAIHAGLLERVQESSRVISSGIMLDILSRSSLKSAFNPL
ncbi:MAG: tetratricopeptide repeat protein [Candidatus Thermoplasmatota archaeon]|nr:tetratricopeptide repeat protein [Candidatus Thermoplasmatota archaeon]